VEVLHLDAGRRDERREIGRRATLHAGDAVAGWLVRPAGLPGRRVNVVASVEERTLPCTTPPAYHVVGRRLVQMKMK
jgi:hypothetical protein